LIQINAVIVLLCREIKRCDCLAATQNAQQFSVANVAIGSKPEKLNESI
jgi:hypothetical protein